MSVTHPLANSIKRIAENTNVTLDFKHVSPSQIWLFLQSDGFAIATFKATLSKKYDNAFDVDITDTPFMGDNEITDLRSMISKAKVANSPMYIKTSYVDDGTNAFFNPVLASLKTVLGIDDAESFLTAWFSRTLFFNENAGSHTPGSETFSKKDIMELVLFHLFLGDDEMISGFFDDYTCLLYTSDAADE